MGNMCASVEKCMVVHPLTPVYDENCRVLILGSFPSVASRETDFYYGHPQNRFWQVVSAVLGCARPCTVEEKRVMLLNAHIALWDVIASCKITGSADSSIRNAAPNDVAALMRRTKICQIYVNGKTALKYYNRYLRDELGVDAVCLPSTSPANAAWTCGRLIESWRVIMDGNQT